MSNNSNKNLIRLNKFIADAGITSRRKADDLIAEGRVLVNNKTVTDHGTKVDPGTDKVMLDGEPIRSEKLIYVVLNKPKSTVTTTDDEKNRKTVLDMINIGQRVYPVGRLDYNTTGVLILTNDGDFANFMMHPSNHIPREYEAKIDRNLQKDDEAKLLKGVYIDNIPGKFDKITFPKKNNFQRVRVLTNEGRNHFVKKMFGQLNYQVKTLTRLSYGGITVDDLKTGEYRILKKDEIDAVYKKYMR